MQSLENLFYFQLRKLSVKKLLGSSLFRLYDIKEVLFLKWNERLFWNANGSVVKLIVSVISSISL